MVDYKKLREVYTNMLCEEGTKKANLDSSCMGSALVELLITKGIITEAELKDTMEKHKKYFHEEQLKIVKAEVDKISDVMLLVYAGALGLDKESFETSDKEA